MTRPQASAAGAALASTRWAKTTPAQRLEIANRMVAARREKAARRLAEQRRQEEEVDQQQAG